MLTIARIPGLTWRDSLELSTDRVIGAELYREADRRDAAEIADGTAPAARLVEPPPPRPRTRGEIVGRMVQALLDRRAIDGACTFEDLKRDFTAVEIAAHGDEAVALARDVMEREVYKPHRTTFAPPRTAGRRRRVRVPARSRVTPVPEARP